MDITILSALVFGFLSLTLLAVLLVARDLLRSGNNATLELDKTPQMGRLTLARDEQPANTITEKIDRSFHQMVIETGLDLMPMVAMLALVCVGMAAGSVVFLLQEDLPLAITAGLLVAAIGWLCLAVKRGRRIVQIQNQFPDVLQLLARAVRAGESFDQAIALVGEKSAEPLATEFRRAARQMQMGLSLPATMRALVHRVRIMEMRIFATTLSVHRQTGGNLAITLERMARVVRDRLNYRRQLRATTAAGRFSAMLVASAGPLLFAYMFLIQPEYIDSPAQHVGRPISVGNSRCARSDRHRLDHANAEG